MTLMTKRQYQGIARLMKSLDQETETLHGIRLADVEGLDKSKWILWDDHRVELAKKNLLGRKKDVLRGEKVIAYKENRHLMSDVSKLESLIANPNFKKVALKHLGEDHDVHEACQIIYDSQNSTDIVETLYSLKQVVKQNDKDWYEKNFSKSYDWRKFNYLCKDIADNYPLLVNISKEVYGWQNMDEKNFGKNMTDYISMCDKLGEEA